MTRTYNYSQQLKMPYIISFYQYRLFRCFEIYFHIIFVFKLFDVANLECFDAFYIIFRLIIV